MINNYQTLGEEMNKIEKNLEGIVGGKLVYIKTKNENIDKYVSYISSKFFKDTENIGEKEIANRIASIETCLGNYNELLEKITNDSTLGDESKKFLIKKVKEGIAKAEIAKKATFFEAEKSGFEIKVAENSFDIRQKENRKNILSEDQKKEYVNDIENLQTEIYGEKVSDNKEERKTILSICNYHFNKNRDRLTPEESEIFQSFLNRFKDDIGTYTPTKEPKDKIKGKLSMETIMNVAEHVKTNFYPNITWTQKQEKGRTSYSADFQTKTRKYPDKNEDVFKKIYTTIGHEDGGHMLRGDNQEKNKLVIAGAGYEDIEEGITKINEGLLQYELNNYKITPNDTFIGVFIGENYNFEDTFRLLKIIKKLKSIKKTPKDIEDSANKTALDLTQRVKSYYPRDMSGSNRKDVIYYRGEQKLVSYLKSLPNDEERSKFYRKAMSAKVSFDDIFILDQLIEEVGGNIEDTNYNKLVDKIFNLKLTKGASVFNKKKDEQGESNIEKNLLKKDFRSNGMQEYTDTEKKALIEIFNMVGYKKYRGQYYQEKTRTTLKNKDNLQKGHIVSFKDTDGQIKKGKVIESSLSNIKIVLQHEGKYTNGEIRIIKKKDIENLENIKVLNKRLTEQTS